MSRDRFEATPNGKKRLAGDTAREATSGEVKALAWRLSNSLDARFCLEALEEALEHHEPPEIMNTDQSLPRA